MSEQTYIRQLAQNRKARHDYHLHETLEAGIVLTGTEVKAARSGNVQLKESHVEIKGDEAFLVGAHISPYTHGNRENHPAVRPRKLLLKRREIDRLHGKSQAKGFTIVALKVFLRGNLIKVEIALASGKKLYDKRQAAKERELDKEARDAVKHASR